MKKLLGIAITITALAVQAAMVQAVGFKKTAGGWKIPKYWNGKLSTKGGNLILAAAEYKNQGQFWGRAMGIRLKSRYELPGRHYRITVRAKGTGEISPGFLVCSFKKNGKTVYNYLKPEKPFRLTKKFARYSYTAKLDNTVASAIVPYINVDGENSIAEISNVQIFQDEPENLQMTDLSGMTVIRKGETAPAKQFKFTRADTAVNTMQFPDKTEKEARCKQEISNAEGVITVPVKADIKGLYKVIAAADGAAATSCILPLDNARYDKLDALAKKVKADKPLTILYLGDSLNDFDRNYNAVDQLSFFLNKYNPGKFKIHNYSVAGDYITRINDRFAGKSNPARYKGIFNRQYDLLIISLGNNDTRAYSTSDYRNPLVPVADIRPDFEKAIATVRAKNPEIPVWVLSSSCSDYDLQVKKSLLRTSKGQTGVRFGIAEHTENFNKELKALAAAGKNIRFIDIYTPMKTAFDPQNYADGVHLSLQGHTFFAQLLLQAFAQK